MTRLLQSKAVRWGFVALTLGFGGYAIALQRHEITQALGRLSPLAIAGALVCVLVAQFGTLRVWQRLLAGLGSPLPTTAAAKILFIGQLGKYLPGSVWPVLAQMELGTVHQVPRHRSASASVLAMLASLLTALLVAAVTLPLTGHAGSYLWAYAAVPLLLACLHPRVLRWGMDRLLRLARRPALEQPLSGSVLARVLGWALFAWVFNGLQIWLLVPAHSGMSLLLSVGGYAFAWSVGFLVVFAPGGLGVREVVLVTTLTPLVGAGTATAVALVSRAVTTASDLICAGVSAAFRRNSARPVVPDAHPGSEAQHDSRGPLQHESLIATDRKQGGAR
jgi:glycosyltransferase 2 family protein